MDKFTRQFFETALWSSTDESREDGGDPFDQNYSITDIDPVSAAGLAAECAEFQRDNAEALADFDDGRAGHDFWLTRNGHGAGFWDGDYPEPQATLLTKASEAYGGVDLYVGDDGVIYASGYEAPRKAKKNGRTEEQKWDAILDANKVLSSPSFASDVKRWNKLKQIADDQGLSDEDAVKFIAHGMTNKAQRKAKKNGRKAAHKLAPGTSVRIYDNGGKTLDRYTVIMIGKDWDSSVRFGHKMMLGLSEGGRGFSQWGEASEGRHLGKSIRWEDLDSATRKHIEARVLRDP